MVIREYKSEDYQQIAALYKDVSTFGGQFDEHRDARERLDRLAAEKRNAILVADDDNEILGTVTIFEDGRSCWLYRFAVKNNDQAVIDALLQQARLVARQLGHTQFLVYAPAGKANFEQRYKQAGFQKGGDYTCYWMDIG